MKRRWRCGIGDTELTFEGKDPPKCCAIDGTPFDGAASTALVCQDGHVWSLVKRRVRGKIEAFAK